MKMKKASLFKVLVGTMLIAVVATACATSATKTQGETGTEEKTDVIKPLYPLESAQDALADGGYSVTFTAEDLSKGEKGYELTVEVFEYDRYTLEDIEKIEVGSKIQFCNQIVTVESVKRDAENVFVEINGGYENDGFDLRKEDNLYRTVTLDDYPIYYSVGEVTIPVSSEATLEDHSDLENEPDGKVSDIEGLQSLMESGDTWFTCANTVITVRQEQIVQIIRHWVP